MKRMLTGLAVAAVACLGLAVLAPAATSAAPSLGIEPDLGSGTIEHNSVGHGTPTVRNVWRAVYGDPEYVTVDIAFLSGSPGAKLNVQRVPLYSPGANHEASPVTTPLALVPGQRRSFTFEYCRGVNLEVVATGTAQVSYRVVQLSNPFLR